jgi:hypothetical protein
MAFSLFKISLTIQEEEQWEQRIETFVQPARKMSAELSDKMKMKLASFEAESKSEETRGNAAAQRLIEPDNTFRDKLKVFKSIETEAAGGRRDSEPLVAPPPPVRRDADAAWLQRSSAAGQNNNPGPAKVAPNRTVAAESGSFQAGGLRRESEPFANGERLRDFPPFRSTSSSSALMNTIQNNKFFQQVRPFQCFNGGRNSYYLRLKSALGKRLS